MQLRLRPLTKQTIVITGGTSGIGLATARAAVRRGACVFLVARNEAALKGVCYELGPRANYAVADVASYEQTKRAAEAACQRFGTFHTWVNNAGIGEYGRIEEIPLFDHRRLFATNFWGVVNGARAALPELRTHGGALINIGSFTSRRAIPLLGMYSASKHAVAGFTDALRMELQQERAPVAVTLVLPGSIDTPFLDHARTFLGRRPAHPPPIYPPQVVADAILHAACHPEREVFVGTLTKRLLKASEHAPRLTDVLMERTFPQRLRGAERKEPDDAHALFEPGFDLQERSLRTRAEARARREGGPNVSRGEAAMLGGLLLGGAAMLAYRAHHSQRSSVRAGGFGAFPHSRTNAPLQAGRLPKNDLASDAPRPIPPEQLTPEQRAFDAAISAHASEGRTPHPADSADRLPTR